MNVEKAEDRCKMIFTGEQMNRITINEFGGSFLVEVDVHGLKCNEADRFVKNIIALLSRFGNFIIEVIHGYNHGTAIKSMLWSTFHDDYVKKIYWDGHNLGATYMAVAA